MRSITHLSSVKSPLRKLTTPEQNIKLENTVNNPAIPTKYFEPNLYRFLN